jgi:preprotein translocase subunit SecD
MAKIKKAVKNTRVIILLVSLFIALYLIYPNPFADGVSIRSVTTNSSAIIAGIENPQPNAPPMRKERIGAIEINNIKHDISNVIDFHEATSNLVAEQQVRIFTNKNIYLLETKPITETIVTDELIEEEIPLTVEKVIEEDGKNKSITEYVTENITKTINETFINQTNFEPYFIPKNITTTVNKTKIILVNKTITNIIGVEDLGLNIFNAPKTNLRKGLDLQGGTRVILEPEKQLSEDDMDILKSNMERRLNVFGLSDVIIRIVRDKPALLGGLPKFILVEIPGANEQEVEELLSKQGKFEAKIKNETVFRGGQDITYVCRSAECSGIDPNAGCGASGSGWSCRFSFSISLKPEAARRQANATSNLAIVGTGRNRYLEEQLKLHLDDQEVDALNIGASLKGRAVTDIQISGSGIGRTQQEAILDSLGNMKRLQTILITGSLPVKLNVVRTDNISPVLGSKFINNAILIGILALFAVSTIVIIRYRNINIALPMLFALASEIIMLLGLASFIGWNLDIAAIAGIIVATGTGVDHLIVITDETLSRKRESFVNWKERLKSAFFIISGAYFTITVAMLPLLFAGAGLLKGFALTTIAGVTLGVFIARPAYAKMLEELVKKH